MQELVNFSGSTPGGNDTPTGSTAGNTPKTPAMINTTSATSRIMHPPEDISLVSATCIKASSC